MHIQCITKTPSRPHPITKTPGAMNLKYDLNHITKTETADGLDTMCPCHI